MSDVLHRLFPPPFIRLGPPDVVLYRLDIVTFNRSTSWNSQSLSGTAVPMTRIRGLPTVMKRLLSILGYLGVAPYPTTSIGMDFAIG